MLSMHCVSHKLALASESAAAAVPYCNNHHSTLTGLYNYFHTSPNHYSVLKRVMEVLHDPVLSLQQVHTFAGSQCTEHLKQLESAFLHCCQLQLCYRMTIRAIQVN